MSLDDYTIIIPARKGSKGLPLKNRKLINYTISSIPSNLKHKVVISTDDEEIKNKFSDFKIFNRTQKSANDTASIKSVILEMKEKIKTKNIIMLYLTYPERKFEDIISAVCFYESNKAKSLLCSKKISSSPYLMLFKKGIKGQQVIQHNLYRRQDYPECFELSHFVCIFNTEELDKLNNNLYNEDTIFYPIEEVVDVDAKKDLERFHENKNNS